MHDALEKLQTQSILQLAVNKALHFILK